MQSYDLEAGSGNRVSARVRHLDWQADSGHNTNDGQIGPSDPSHIQPIHRQDSDALLEGEGPHP